MYKSYLVEYEDEEELEDGDEDEILEDGLEVEDVDEDEWEE